MDSQKINHLQIEKPKILNTLSSLNRNESNHILNEYRTRGSESLMPIKQMHFERSRKKLLPTLNETSEGKNKLLDNFTDKLQKNDKIHSKKKINFTIPAHSKSPVKLNRQILKPLDPIEESGNQNQKIDFVLRGVKSRFMKPNVELRMSALKEKNKDNIAELQFYKVFF